MFLFLSHELTNTELNNSENCAALTHYIKNTAYVESCIPSHVEKKSIPSSAESDSTQGELFTAVLFQPHHKAYLINGLGP